MTKEEFLAMSLPYYLLMQYSENNILAEQTYYLHPATIFNNGNPILHPLSDLTKPIVHKGEAFVPAIKLAKIATNNDFINYSITIENGTIIVENIAKFSSLNMQFEIDLDNGIIDFCYCDCNGRDYPFSNQLQLFQKLVEWHFDIANLIQKGEAIDINTLEINPYK